MNRRRAGYRDRWIEAVLQTDKLNPSCKLVCIALSRHMSDEGRVRHRREDIAAALGWKTVQRVTDRIKEAKDAQFLSHVAGGINGAVAVYDAMIPLSGTSSWGTSSGGPGNGSRGTRNGVPDSGVITGPGTPPRGAIRARATSRTREQEPAPDGSRVERDQPRESTTSTYSEWIPTPLKRSSSEPRTDVA